MIYYDIQEEIDEKRAEIDAIRLMSKYDVCRTYNVDIVEEIINIIEEDIQSLQNEYAASICEEAEIEGIDPEDFVDKYGDIRYMSLHSTNY